MVIDTAADTSTHMAALGRWSGNDPDRPLVCVITTHRATEADAIEVRDTAERLHAGAWRCLRTIVPRSAAAAAAFEAGRSPASAEDEGGRAFGAAALELVALHDADLFDRTGGTAAPRVSGKPTGRLRRPAGATRC